MGCRRPASARPEGLAGRGLPVPADRPRRLPPPGQQASPQPQGRTRAAGASPASRSRRARGRGLITVRTSDGTVRAGHYRLITTLLDPTSAPARELAATYARRWAVETGFREIKTYLRGSPAPCGLRIPKSPTRNCGPTSSSTRRSA
nr:transposase [Streptomyces pathocidini]